MRDELVAVIAMCCACVAAGAAITWQFKPPVRSCHADIPACVSHCTPRGGVVQTALRRHTTCTRARPVQCECAQP